MRASTSNTSSTSFLILLWLASFRGRTGSKIRSEVPIRTSVRWACFLSSERHHSALDFRRSIHLDHYPLNPYLVLSRSKTFLLSPNGRILQEWNGFRPLCFWKFALPSINTNNGNAHIEDNGTMARLIVLYWKMARGQAWIYDLLGKALLEKAEAEVDEEGAKFHQPRRSMFLHLWPT